jgi:NTE family protein
LVISPLRAFCSRNVDALAIAEGTISPWASRNDVLTREYDGLYDQSRLAGLPDRPRFVFNATNLQTGRNVRLSKPYLADYRIGKISNPDLKLAVAVSASSAFPPVLSPCEIDVDPDAWEQLSGADLFADPRYKQTLSLTDGGVYDNLGLETVDTFETILVSDAGAPFGLHDKAKTDTLGQMTRSLDIATDQARGLRKNNLIEFGKLRKQKVAYWGIDTDYGEYPAANKLSCDPNKTIGLKDVRTRLNEFSTAEQETLINWGYALCDAAMRSYVEPTSDPPLAWPCADHPLG